MKLTFLSILTLAGIILEARAADAPDIPNVSCRRDNYGAVTKTERSSGSRSTSVTRNFGIVVELFSYKLPKAPYDVQCFFIARNEGTKEEYIYNIQQQTSSLISEKLKFQAPDLQGTQIHTNISTFTGTAISSSGGTHHVTGSASSRSTTLGDKPFGYLIRVLSQGKVVRIESDQALLKIKAEKNPSIFDQAVKGSK